MGFKKGYVLYYLKCIITNTASLLDFERWPREGEILIKYVIIFNIPLYSAKFGEYWDDF